MHGVYIKYMLPLARCSKVPSVSPSKTVYFAIYTDYSFDAPQSIG